MLKKIDIAELRLGMHLHELCGNWIDHPFWRTKFLLCDPADLERLRESGLAECWIDASKGLDVAALAPTLEAPSLPAAAPASTPLPAPPAGPSERAVGLEEECGRAAALLRDSRQLVKSMFQEARMGRAVDTAGCLPLVEEITKSVWRNPGALVSLARLKTHDDYSYMHSVAVCGLMVALARQLGQDEMQARDAGLAGLLHDMGKALMPLSVLNKPGKLTPGEFDLMRTHPRRGRDLLRDSPAVSAAVLDVCLHHHERPDGNGYPEGLGGDQLSLVAKMGSICDVYDAITSNRPYKIGWDPSESIVRMSEWSRNGQFDPAVFLGFMRSLGVYPVGSLVRMRSQRLAVVVEQNPQHLLAPRVRVFFSTRSAMPVPLEWLDTSSSSCGDAIVGRESNAVWKFKHLDELWAGREVLAKAAAPAG